METKTSFLPIGATQTSSKYSLQNSYSFTYQQEYSKEKNASWAEKSAQLEKNMFPVGELFFPNWKPCFWGLLTFYSIFCHFPRSKPPKHSKNKSKKI
ncbi:MAG: hypothetical protein IIV53_06785 [Bacteroidaceae bacterium]|nr:hypothetical protein [Bacteroidaceae bacterium]